MAEVRSNLSRFCDLRTFLPYFPEPTGAVFDFTVDNEAHVRQKAVIFISEAQSPLRLQL